MKFALPVLLLSFSLPSQTFRELVSSAFDSPLPGGIRVVLDVDGDGDNDLLVDGPSGVGMHFYRNDGFGTFECVSTSSASIQSQVSRDAVGDYDGDVDFFAGKHAYENLGNGTFAQDSGVTVSATGNPPSVLFDHDGDEDLLVVAAQSSVLRNDGGVFVLVPDVAPPGTLIDANHDSCADVLVSADVLVEERIFFNERNLLTTSGIASLGRNWPFKLSTWRSGSPAQAAWIAIGFVETFVDVPGIGGPYVNPMFADVMMATMINGTAERVLAIPSDPSVTGVALVAQAVVFDLATLQLSNVVREHVR